MSKTSSAKSRFVILIGSVVVSIVIIAGLDATLQSGAGGKENYLATLLLDRGGSTYPLSIQNMMWVVFIVGLGELVMRLTHAMREADEVDNAYLPEDDETLLLAEDMPEIYRKVTANAQDHFLPRMLKRIILQFQSSHSVDQANSLLNSSLELFLHEIDLRYTVPRYIMWLIPTLGFIGTVVGISNALEYAGGADFQATDLLANVTAKLALAFNTTFVALVMSGVLVLMMNIVQAMEETALNRSGQYCLDNFINRLYEESDNVAR